MEVIPLDKLVISGPTKLKGEVIISGAKKRSSRNITSHFIS